MPRILVKFKFRGFTLYLRTHISTPRQKSPEQKEKNLKSEWLFFRTILTNYYNTDLKYRQIL